MKNQHTNTLCLCLSLQRGARLPAAGRAGGPHVEGGRPPGGHATAGHAPTGHAQPRGLAPSRGAARHHQEEQEEVLLVPLRGRRGSAEDRARDIFDAAAHRGGKKQK